MVISYPYGYMIIVLNRCVASSCIDTASLALKTVSELAVPEPQNPTSVPQIGFTNLQNQV